MGFLVLWLVERLWAVSWSVLTVLAARLLQVPLRDVTIGSGPSWPAGSVGGIAVRFGALPLGASVRRAETARFLPVAVAAGPALLLGSVAGALAPTSIAQEILAFVVPLLAFATPDPPGLLQALVAAAELARVDPIGVGLALFGTIGVMSAIVAALGQLARYGPIGVGVYLLVQVWLFVAVLRGLVLDFT